MAGHYFVSLLPFAALAFATQYFQQPDDLPQVDYDFIVVGGGSAGAIVGGRLGEIEDYKILVIEAGPSNDDVFEAQVPGLSHSIGFGTRVDWNYTTAPQTNVSNRVLTYPRAMILGGCSSHNDMIYNRGSKDDYDRWATTIEDDNLSWANMYSYILKAEKWSPPNDPSYSEEGHYDPSVHDDNGKIGVTAPYYDHPFNDILFEAATELSEEFPLLEDLNNGRPIGLGWGQATIAYGLRSSSATGHLASASDNVHVLLNSFVTRVLPVDEGSNNFRKVELTTSPESPTLNITAAKEVILSAGMINTPQLLLLSGIGPKDELEALGLETIVDNPSVGKNFSDQSSIPLSYSTDLPATSFNQKDALAQWQSNHTGRLALAGHLPQMGWVRFPPDSEPFRNGLVDPTGGPNAPHIEIFFSSVNPGFGGNQTLGMNIVNLSPTSRGAITLASASPFDQPIIDPALLTSPVDSAILLEGFRSVQRLMASESFSKNVFGLSRPQPSKNGTLTDEEVMNYIKTSASHFGHGVGSCSMAPAGASWGVVDPEFRVRDTEGLRVVDASVIPFVTSGHIQAPVYAIAEWASEVIKRSYQT
ncbi:hypothetical protein D9756_010021 [Leucocoprinus leucothites]|uniref:pyranose dehydrogenase (acceptor) n=1 Tax=Leucocoprinus leucothites TaxID=201217 RepID=A0A8H5CSW4_9AGAR|nr:hypothetical protein D9756_010021 [Leucoagaricus leucothites]